MDGPSEVSNMSSLIHAILAVAISTTAGVSDSAPAAQFSAAMPQGWRASSQITLVLHEVEVPSNTAAILRVYALEGKPSERHLLGSYGLPAISPDAKGTTQHARLPIAVTNGLKRWRNAPADGEKVAILVEPVDGKGRPLPAYDWKAREVTLEAR
jgi:hypothetical protein